MANFDLRHWLTQVEGLGELRAARGAHWNLEIGAIAELILERRDAPAILFDDIPGIVVQPLHTWRIIR